MMEELPLFAGTTFNKNFDEDRLKGLLHRVYRLMSDGAWRTLEEIKAATGGSEAGISARLRDLRKAKFGNHVVNKRRQGDKKRGLWAYRLEI